MSDARSFQSVERTRPSAFTLIELLVVVAIIIALLAILLPSMNRAIEAANRVVCLSNQHQITIGAISHASDNVGELPLYRSWTTHFISGSVWYNYDARDYLLGVVGQNPEVFYCPSDTRNSADNADTGWNAGESSPYQTRYISYSPIGMWEQATTSIQYPKHYTGLPAKTGFTTSDQGNRPKRMGQANQPAQLAFVTDSQNSWDAALGFSFTYPGDNLWQESSTYYANWAYPHRDGDNAWAGGNTVMYDGSGGWGDFDEIFDDSAAYPHGAKWIMHYQRGVYEGAMFW